MLQHRFTKGKIDMDLGGNMKPRNFQVVADEITKIIYEECTFDKDKTYSIIQQIDKVKKR